MAKSGFVWTKDTLTPGLARLGPRTRMATIAVVRRQAPKAEAHMRRTAPWTDRSGNARGGLNAHSEHGATKDELVLAHGVSYGIWLEVAHGAEYAVVTPSIRPQGEEIMRSLQGLLALRNIV